jgi:hypothetical protein
MKRLLILPVAALAFAACGGPSTTDYVRSVNDAVNATGNQIADLSSSIDETAPRESDTAVYDEQANELRGLAKKLTALKDAPKGFEAPVSELATAINALAQDVDSAETTSAEDFSRKIQVDSTRIQSAINAINGKV